VGQIPLFLSHPLICLMAKDLPGSGIRGPKMRFRYLRLTR